MMIVELNVNIL